MGISGKRWIEAEVEESGMQDLEQALQISTPLARLLVSRNHTSLAKAERFLNPSLNGLIDPMLVPGVPEAVERIWKAIDDQESIVIHGDYDVDGITSTSLMVHVLKALGAVVEPFIPHRVNDGYGLSEETVQQCIDLHKAKLIITVDCGTGSVLAVEYAKKHSVEVIVTDHHESGDEIADAYCLVNPKLGDDHEGSHLLAGVGVAFKLCHALVGQGRRMGKDSATRIDLKDYLYLVAMGTVADMVPLEKENRILARAGLQQLNGNVPPGIRALIDVCGIQDEIKSYHIGFQLGPRINAAGRLSNPDLALSLLIEDNAEKAYDLARTLDQTNKERQELEQGIVAQAINDISDRFNPETDFGIVIGGEGWHPGVIGIVASRLVQQFNRPSIVIGFDDEGMGKGSCRSIEGFDLLEGLTPCSDYLERFGGHKMAAGLEIKQDNLPALADYFNVVCASHLKGTDLRPRQRIDAWVTMGDLTQRLIDETNRLEPFGLGNARPIWAVRGIHLESRLQVVGKKHLKMRLTDGHWSLDGIAFNADYDEWPEGTVDVAFQLQLNKFRGQESLQLVIQAVRKAGEA